MGSNCVGIAGCLEPASDSRALYPTSSEHERDLASKEQHAARRPARRSGGPIECRTWPSAAERQEPLRSREARGPAPTIAAVGHPIAEPNG
jgi:hypothetical protein